MNEKLKLARNKLLDNVIDDDEYFEIKSDYKEQIERLESKLTKEKAQKKIGFPTLIDNALEYIVNLAKVYDTSDNSVKRKIIGSVFPE